MADILSQTQIDDLLKQILEPNKVNEPIKNIWACSKCRKQWESFKSQDERDSFIFGKHIVLKSLDGITSVGVFDNSGRVLFRGALSRGITTICLKCGYKEILIKK